MKRYLTPLLIAAASLTAISANAGAPSYFIPTEPTVITPADQATDVEITPALTSSDFLFSENLAPDNNPTLSISNWVISKKSAAITILGSEKASNQSPAVFSFEYDVPLAINISGQTVTKLQVVVDGAYQTVKLLSIEDKIIALADIAFSNFDFQTDRKFVISKTSSNSMLLQWHLKDAESTEAIIEFMLIDTGLDDANIAKADVFGWRTTPNEYANTLFDSENSGAGCKVATDNTSSNSSYVGDAFLDWKAAEAGTYDKFYLACTSASTANEGEYAVNQVELNLTDVTSFLPDITVFSSATEAHTLDDASRLSPNTEYSVQVQHTGITAPLTGDSSWSTPVSFTTRAADTNYQVTVPTDLAFTTGQAKDLAFNISNTGSETGAPRVIIRLPFEALSIIEGTISDFFNVSIGDNNCELYQSDGKTDFVCHLDSLEAAAEVQLTAKLTVQDTTISKIEYQVCEPAKCAATAFTAVGITVTTSGGSSSGGSMFWLFLMTPLLLVRRK